jgi:hypothetical protein
MSPPDLQKLVSSLHLWKAAWMWDDLVLHSWQHDHIFLSPWFSPAHNSAAKFISIGRFESPQKKKNPPWPILESCFRIVKPTILEQKDTTTNANCSKMKHPGTAWIPWRKRIGDKGERERERYTLILWANETLIFVRKYRAHVTGDPMVSDFL